MSERREKVDFATVIAFAFVGFAYALLPLFASALLTGAGHGWYGGVVVSANGLWLLPLFGIAHAFRRRPAGKYILAVVALAAIALDIIAFRLDPSSFKRINVVYGSFLIWLLLWAAWQLLLLKKIIQTFLGPKLPD